MIREALRPGAADWKDTVTWQTLRVAAGMVLPLAAGAASGHVEDGAFASLGALPAGIASFQGVTRTRVAAAAVASAGMAVSTFVGGTVAAAAPWLLVPVSIVCGYVTGLAVCLGPLAGVAVAQWPVALLIAVGLPLRPGDAALRAGFVLAGGPVQEKEHGAERAGAFARRRESCRWFQYGYRGGCMTWRLAGMRTPTGSP